MSWRITIILERFENKKKWTNVCYLIWTQINFAQKHKVPSQSALLLHETLRGLFHCQGDEWMHRLIVWKSWTRLHSFTCRVYLIKTFPALSQHFPLFIAAVNCCENAGRTFQCSRLVLSRNFFLRAAPFINMHNSTQLLH